MTGLDSTTRLLLALAVLLGLSRLAGMAASWLRQPPVVGEILAGVALGPSLLGHTLPALHHSLFGPDVMPSVNGLAQVGLALYAFEIGNELTAPGRSRPGSARPLLWLTAASLLAPALAALLLGPHLHAEHLGGAHGSSAPLTVFLACSLGVTAVPVLARLLQDRGMADTTVGRLSLAAASVGDGVCWCLLALALHLTGLIGTGRTIAGVAGAAVAVLVIHRRHGRPPGRSDGRQWGLAPMLALLCLAAGTSSALGLHPLLGGLLLGAAWPSTGRSSEVLRRIRPMAAALLPCFFLGMGQQIDVTSAVTASGFVPLVLLLLGAAVLTKLVACTGAGLGSGSRLRESARLGVLMNAKGLTEIVVLSIGYQDGLIGRTLFEALIVVALITTVLTGPALALLDRPSAKDRERAGRTGPPSAPLEGVAPLPSSATPS